MSLDFKEHWVDQLIGTKSLVAPSTGPNNAPSFLIAPATLTALYAGNVSSAISCAGKPKLNFNVQYKTNGNGNSLQLKVEWSSDNVNFFQETSELVTPGSTVEYLQERTFDNNGSSVSGTTYSFRLPLDIADKYFRISAKETVAAGTAGTLYVEGVSSGR